MNLNYVTDFMVQIFYGKGLPCYTFLYPQSTTEKAVMLASPIIYVGYKSVKEYGGKIIDSVVSWFSSSPEPKSVESHTNYIDEVYCYTDSTTNWDATKGNPFENNHIQKIVVYRGAKVNFINFTPQLHAQYQSLLIDMGVERYLQTN